MEKEQKQPQPQGPQPPPQQQQQSPKGQEQLKQQISRGQEYQKQLTDQQTKYWEKVQSAWDNYYKNTEHAYNVYQDTVREIHEGAKKATAVPESEGSPKENLQAFKEVRLKNLHAAYEVHTQLRHAERKYGQVLTSFWDDVFNTVSQAVKDFWDWIVGWWEEPPVEGAAPLRALADPAWRPAFDPTAIAYSGWNYGASLY